MSDYKIDYCHHDSVTAESGQEYMKNCNNCEYQIEPLRMCEWAEHGGDLIVHLICPRWEKRKSIQSQGEER